MRRFENLDRYDGFEFDRPARPLRYDPDVGPQFARAKAIKRQSNAGPAYVAVMVSLAAAVAGMEYLAWILQ